VIEFREINLEPDVLSRFGAGVEDVRAGCMPLMQRATCTSARICAIAFGLHPRRRWLGTGALASRDPSDGALGL